MKDDSASYYDSQEFTELLASYENMLTEGSSIYFDSLDIANIAEYYTISGEVDKADAAVDYVAYLLETEGETLGETKVPQMKGQSLIDKFINVDKGRFSLSEDPQAPQMPEETPDNDENEPSEGIFTETLARIYIKQGKYSQALEIIQRLSLVYPKKNAYFADQIRFLKKLIINNNTK